MLTRLRIRNFKRFEDVDIELGNPVVFIGPNNSGKTAALQALALWETGVRRWSEKRGTGTGARKPGVTLNRLELLATPVSHPSLLWRNLHLRDVRRTNGKPETRPVFIEVIVEGVTDGVAWECGLEFDYANPESLYCRPLRLDRADGTSLRMDVPGVAAQTRVAFLPSIGGLGLSEDRLEPGAVARYLGEGQTARVLRNLCYRLWLEAPDAWDVVAASAQSLFEIELRPPEYIPERGELRMAYRERGGAVLDLPCAGRGMQQVLLLLVHLHLSPGRVLLLDEPDAHLETIRQREVYSVLVGAARELDSQLIIATHSEVVLDEAADTGRVVAFVGKPHAILGSATQIRKALRDIPAADYYQAERTGWVLYLEGSTDLAVLKAFARSLSHPAAAHLERPFVRYVGNQPIEAARHFHGVREGCPDLSGVALFDRLDRAMPSTGDVQGLQWRKREIENYLCVDAALLKYARSEEHPITSGGGQDREAAMRASIQEMIQSLAVARKPSPWSPDLKVTDEFLDPLFANYFERLGLPNLLRKNGYHTLASLVPADQIDPEVTEKLDAIAEVAASATPAEE